MNTKNSKTNESKRFRLYFTDKLSLTGNKTIALASLSIYYAWQNVKTINLKFQTVLGMRPLISYNISDIQDYFESIIKKHETIIADENSPVLIYPNKIKNRTVFKMKTGYKLELMSNETMKLLGDSPC